MWSLRSSCEKEWGGHWSFATKDIESLCSLFLRREGVISYTGTGLEIRQLLLVLDRSHQYSTVSNVRV